MSWRNHELRQIGALPFFLNANDGLDVCLVTSRGGGRWIIPKGNPIPGLAPHEVASKEALEEAGPVAMQNDGASEHSTFRDTAVATRESIQLMSTPYMLNDNCKHGGK